MNPLAKLAFIGQVVDMPDSPDGRLERLTQLISRLELERDELHEAMHPAPTTFFGPRPDPNCGLCNSRGLRSG